MSTRPAVSRFSRTVAAGFVSMLPLTVFAVDRTPARSLNISIFSDHYITAEKQFTDLDALEGWVKVSPPRVLRLYACGAESAARLLAAVERFQHAYIELRMAETGQPGCTTIAAGRSIPVAATQAPASERDPAVGRYWRNVMP